LSLDEAYFDVTENLQGFRWRAMWRSRSAPRSSKRPALAKKRGIMTKWTERLELQVQAAIANDRSLLDADAVGEAYSERGMATNVGKSESPVRASAASESSIIRSRAKRKKAA
jgi:hypothetical protein